MFHVDHPRGRRCLDHKSSVLRPGQLCRLRSAFDSIARRQMQNYVVNHLLRIVKINRCRPVGFCEELGTRAR